MNEDIVDAEFEIVADAPPDGERIGENVGNALESFSDSFGHVLELFGAKPEETRAKLKKAAVVSRSLGRSADACGKALRAIDRKTEKIRKAVGRRGGPVPR